MKTFFLLLITCFVSSFSEAQITHTSFEIEHHYADNNGVKIHYVTAGEGPLVLFVHGFPDFWYTWRHQMESLSSDYTVAAIDLRGYNLSDKPKGVENYTFDVLVEDVVAVIKASGEKSAYLVAHDWGAAISWRVAAQYPELIERLIILSIAHPKAGDQKPIVERKEKGKPSYADYFVSEEFSSQLNENWFSNWVTDIDAKQHYKQAFLNSDKDAMINYYRANYPTLENLRSEEFLERRKRNLPTIQMPVMVIHGKEDKYAPTKAHNNTWDFVENEFSIHILPNTGHFIQRDESAKVTDLIREFLSKE